MSAQRLFKIRNKVTGGWLWGTRGVEWRDSAGGTPSYMTAKHAHRKLRDIACTARVYRERDGETSIVATHYQDTFDVAEVVEYELREVGVVES